MKKSLVAISDVIAAHLPTGPQMLSKVPEVTLFFWIIKILATTVGETGADYLTKTIKDAIPLPSAAEKRTVAVVGSL